MSASFSLPLRIKGERVVCAFPCIGQDYSGPYFQSAEVVTTDDDKGPQQTFTVRRVNADQSEEPFADRTFSTFPAAIREARKRCGWG